MPAISMTAFGTGGGGASALADLSDVLISSLANGDLLQYNLAGSKWVNIAPSTVTVGAASAVPWSGVSSKPAEVTQAATTSLSGWLTSTDWNTFNNKQAAISVSDTASVDLTLTGAQISAAVLPAGVDHNSLSNYVANQHIDWTNATSALVTTGAGTFNDLDAKWLDLTTGLSDPAYVAGRIFYDNANNTLCVYSDVANTSLQVGQEQLVRAVNKTGATLTDGTVVYISGAQGNRPSIAKADADNSTADKTIGVVTADIADNAEGYVCIQGVVRNFNTSGFTTGDELFVSQTAGAITNVRPTHPAHDVRVGWALNSTANGSILVATHSAVELSGLHDVLISTPLNGQALTYETSSGLWKNSTLPTVITDHGGLSGLSDDDHSIYAKLGGRSGGQTLYGDTAASGNLTLGSTANATKGKMLFGTLAAWDETTGYIGIGHQSPTAAIDIQGSSAAAAQLSLLRATTTAAGPSIINLYRTRGTVGSPSAILSGDSVGSMQINGYGATAFSAGVGGRAGFIAIATENWSDSAHGLRLDLKSTPATSTTIVTTATCNGSNFGIGTTTPSVPLDVVGAAKIGGDLTVDTNTFFVDSTNNRVAVGTTSPSYNLHVTHSAASSCAVTVANTNASYSADLVLMGANRSYSNAFKISSLTSEDQITGTRAMTLNANTGVMSLYGGYIQTSELRVVQFNLDTPSFRTFNDTISWPSQPEEDPTIGPYTVNHMPTATIAGDNPTVTISEMTTLLVDPPAAGVNAVLGSAITINGNGVSVFGNYSGGHYAQFESDGTLVFYGNATVHRDIFVSGLATRAGANAPTFAAFKGGIYTNRFDDGAVAMEVHGSFEMQHDYKAGSALSVHVHWSPTTTNTGNIRWGLEYTIASKDETFPTTTTIYVTQAGSGVVDRQQMVSFADISGTGVDITDVLAFRLFRDSNNAADTFTGNAFLHQVGIHYEADTCGSRARTSK